jgi:hypothetical protein
MDNQQKFNGTPVDIHGQPHDSYLTDDFFMYQFKCTWCPITVQHNWQTCMYAHNYQDARRSPQMGYGPQPCPHWDKKQRAPMYGQRCPNGVLCPFSHGAKEQLYHPHYFKTVVCWDFTHTKEGCPRERLCAFYHRKRTQRKGGHTVYVSPRQVDYDRLLPQDSLQFVQPDFGCPPFSSGDKENSGVGESEGAQNGAPHGGMHEMPPRAEGHGQWQHPNQGYWYPEDQQHHQMESPVMSPHGGNGPMLMLPHMGSDGSPTHSQVGSPTHMNGSPTHMNGSPTHMNGSPTHMNGSETPMRLDNMWEQQWPSADHPQSSPNGTPVTVADPGRHQQVMMVPQMPLSPSHQMPLSPSHQAPMGPQGYPMNGNVMMQGNMMLVPADGPYYNQSQSQPPQQMAPPQPAAKDSDDLLDVRSWDSMDFFENQPAPPVLPPVGLKMNYGVGHKFSDATTSGGEGTSGSASNSD